MGLELTVLRCPDAVPPEARQVSGGEFAVGRGPGVDWVLPDTERTLSKRHFVVAFRSGGWQLADTSTNGTFLNASPEPLGAGDVRNLRDGDRIRVGAYEIEARVTDDAQAYGGGMRSGFGAAPRGGADPFGDPFGADPMAPPPPAHQPFGGAAQPKYEPAPILPDDFDLLGTEPLVPPGNGFNTSAFAASVQSDHSSVMQDAFQPPRGTGQPPASFGGPVPPGNILSDDWANDLLDGIGGAPPPSHPEPVAPPPPPSPPPAPPVEALWEPPAPAVEPVPRPQPAARQPLPAEPSPFDEPSDIAGGNRLGEPIVSLPVSRAAPPAPEPAASIFDDPLDPGPAPSRPEPPEARQPLIAPEPPPRRAPPPPRIPEPAALEPAEKAAPSLLLAFLEGAEMPDGAMKDPEGTMRNLGAAFRGMVSGLREVLIARASIKSEFRIEQTMIRARGNNPLKFSAGDDDALSALLGSGRRVDMTPAEAVTDALRDIRLHELASMAAMQSAVRSLLEGLEPTKLRAAADQGGGMTVLPAQRKARAWDAYEVLFNQTIQALSDDFDSVFGKAFARAYERAMSDISQRERR